MQVVANGTGPLPYPALNSAFDALYPKGIRAYWKGAFVKELPADAIATIVEHGSRVPEISANKYVLNIRFLSQSGEDARTRTADWDVPFELTFCNL